MTETDALSKFFDRLASRGGLSLPANASGTVRFEAVADGRTERWLVIVRHGAVTVAPDDGEADLVIHGDRELLERIVEGKANAMAAALRGGLSISGAAELLVAVQQLFPRPQDDRG